MPAPIVYKQKLQNETIEEMEQSVPMSPLTKCVSTPASLQTIVRFQNGAPNTMSLQQQVSTPQKFLMHYYFIRNIAAVIKLKYTLATEFPKTRVI